MKLFYQPNTSFTYSCNVCPSLWQVWSLACEQYTHRMKSFFLARLGKGPVVFLSHFHTPILVGFPLCSLWSATTAVYPLLLRLWQLSSLLLKLSVSYPVWCNLHYPRKKIAYAFKWSFGIFDAGQVSWMLDSVNDICESKTWKPNVCLKLNPACRPLQTMQAPSAYRQCFSVEPIMPPSPLSTAFGCSWSYMQVDIS